jgi:ATP-dependent Zn protease
VFGGQTSSKLPTQAPTLATLTDLVTLSLGGRAADIVLGSGPNVGAENDLVQATELLLGAHERQGLFDSLVSMRRERAGLRPDATTSRMIDAELKRLLKRAIDIIESCRPAALELIDRLIEERVLSGAEAAGVMRRHAGECRIADRGHPPGSS